ncbi:MAG: hypothetical protein IJ583_06090 [Firmicutes bacterium]|nr:hypothetical protein [Bacillota bacterium]
MAILINKENNVILKIDLIKNSYADIDNKRCDNENWIPFTLCFECDEEKIIYDAERKCTFNIGEIKNLINMINDLEKYCENKISYNKQCFCPVENYFEICFYDTFEKNEINVEFWVNYGEYTLGRKYGYDKGVRFVVDLQCLVSFANDLKIRFNEIISDSENKSDT